MLSRSRRPTGALWLGVAWAALASCSDDGAAARPEPAPPEQEARDSGDEAETVDLEQLRALGYTAGSYPATDEHGVIVNDPRAWRGFNLYTSMHGPEAFLLDMEGRELHRWTCDVDAVTAMLDDAPLPVDYLRRVHLFPNGDLLAILDYGCLVKMDKDSRLLWAYGGGAHHDLDIDENGDIYVLGHQDGVTTPLRESAIRDEFVAILDSQGREKDRIWLSAALLDSTFERYKEVIPIMAVEDVFHANTLSILDGALAERAPFLARGNLLVSLRTLGVVAIIDPGERVFTWMISGPWRMQHQPVMLASGRMLLFDNRMAMDPDDERSSRVLEFDPLQGTLHWDYTGTDETPFYSSVCGSAQRLPGGNTLITESDYGRVFEVTEQKEIVWEFRSPHTVGKGAELVAHVPEMIRIAPDFPVANFVRD